MVLFIQINVASTRYVYSVHNIITVGRLFDFFFRQSFIILYTGVILYYIILYLHTCSSRFAARSSPPIVLSSIAHDIVDGSSSRVTLIYIEWKTRFYYMLIGRDDSCVYYRYFLARKMRERKRERKRTNEPWKCLGE